MIGLGVNIIPFVIPEHLETRVRSEEWKRIVVHVALWPFHFSNTCQMPTICIYITSYELSLLLSNSKLYWYSSHIISLLTKVQFEIHKPPGLISCAGMAPMPVLKHFPIYY